MRKLKAFTTCLITFSTVLCWASITRSQGINNGINEIKNIQIDTLNRTSRVGEPLLVQLMVEYEKPVLDDETNRVVPNLSVEAFYEIIKMGQESNRANLRPVYPGLLMSQDDEGMRFGGTFPILYDHLKKSLSFDKPGTYSIRVEVLKGMSSEIEVTIGEATSLVKKALLLLSDPNDYAYLEFSGHEFRERRPKRMSHLKKVVEQCEGTVLAKWAAARLGLEYFKQFHAKNPSFTRFKALREKDKVKEPLFEQTRKYLEIGAKLPDEFPIREDLLRQLMKIEYMDGNYAGAFSIIDEVSAKYPKGKYGKRATKWKQELLKLQKREQKQD